jgi:hypothetical protein
MKFELTQNDAAALLGILGQLPTNTGVYPILVNLVAQYNEQNKAADAPAE